MDDGFARAQALYDRQEPPERKEIGGFGIGDRVKIDRFFLGPASDGFDTNGIGVVDHFENGYISVECGRRLILCLPEDLEAI